MKGHNFHMLACITNHEYDDTPKLLSFSAANYHFIRLCSDLQHQKSKFMVKINEDKF